MDQRAKNLLNKLEIYDQENYLGLKIINNFFNKETNAVFLEILIDQEIPSACFFKLLKKNESLWKKYANQYKIKYCLDPRIRTKKYILELLDYLINVYWQEPYLWAQIQKNDLEFNAQNLSVQCLSNKDYNYFKQYKKSFEEALEMIGLDDCSFILKPANETEITNQAKAKKNQFAQEADSVRQAYFDSLLENNHETNKNYHYARSDVYMSFKEVHQSSEERVSVEGDVFFHETKFAKTGTTIISFALTDYEEALNCIFFLTKKGKDKLKRGEVHPLLNLKIGIKIKVSGQLRTQQNGEKQLIVTRFEIANNAKKILADNQSNKHIEMQFHTKMSTMDGLIVPQELIEYAKALNHQVIGVTDTNNVQSFPDFYRLTKDDQDLKVIYGADISVITKKNKVLLNRQGRTLAKAPMHELTYVVFDIETTGLSAMADHLIEFAALKVAKGKVIAEEHFFVNPHMKLQQWTTRLTSITQDDVDHGLELKEALVRIQDFFAEAICVAHNATFDWQFLEEKFTSHHLELNNLFFDTLQSERLLDPKARSHSLENVSHRRGFAYDTEDAHRADYDTNVLKQVFLASIGDFANRNIETLDDLDSYLTDGFYAKNRSHNLTVWAKNQQGIKELFKIISLLNTKYFYKSPKYHYEDLPRTNNLLYGGGHAGSALFEVLLGQSRTALKEAIKDYDVITITPLDGLDNYFAKYSKKSIIYLTKILVEEALKQKKLIVATASPRYLKPSEKKIHEICIEATGIKNARHSLYEYKTSHPRYPSQHYHYTQEMMKQLDFLDTNIVQEIVFFNPHKMANKISRVEIIKDKLFTPKFDNSGVKLKNLVYHNAHLVYGDPLPQIVAERLEVELQPLLKSGYDVIYWISSKLVAKSLQDGYLVGSRGSVGSSLVATMAGITEVNPLQPHYYCKNCQFTEFMTSSKSKSGYDLNDKLCPQCSFKMEKDGQSIPFATFLGFEADKVPDIDLNFSGLYQAQVHNYVKELFGEEKTFRAGTISTIASKIAFGYVKAHFDNRKQWISNAFISYLSNKITGIKRTTGQHPGGIIIIPQDYQIEDFTPMTFPADDTSSDWHTTHFDFHAIHDNLLKLDILGHDDPTALKYLEKITNFKVKDIPKKDKKIISIFSGLEALNITSQEIGNEPTGALGIPEFGTSFVRKMLSDVQVKNFADLVSVSGLSHGTDVWLGNADEQIKKNHKTLNDVITSRDDIMLHLINKGIDAKSSFTIMEQVRKGKGISAEQKAMLLENGIDRDYINSMAKIKYLFPKAHATAYVIMAWRVAFYKVYFPLHFYSSYFTTRKSRFNLDVMIKGQEATSDEIKNLELLDKQTKLNSKDKEILETLYLCREMQARGFKIENIDINKSSSEEWVVDLQNNSLTPPFNALDGLGIAAAHKLENARHERNFSSIEDFRKRSGVNTTLIKKMQSMGIFKNLDPSDQGSLF